VPFLEMIVQHQIQLDVHMGALAINAIAGVPHDAELIPLLDVLSGVHGDRAQVAIEAVVFATIESMFDHDIPAVIRIARRLAGVHHHARGNRPDGIGRLAAGVALERFDIDAFVQPRVNNFA